MNFFVHVINDDPHGFRKQEYEGIPNCAVFGWNSNRFGETLDLTQRLMIKS